MPFGGTTTRRRPTAPRRRLADGGARARLVRLLLPPWHAVGGAGGGDGGSRRVGGSGGATAGPAEPESEPEPPRDDGGFEGAIFAGADGEDGRDDPSGGSDDGSSGSDSSSNASGVVQLDLGESDDAGESPQDADSSTVEDSGLGGQDTAFYTDSLDEDAPIEDDGDCAADDDTSEAIEGLVRSIDKIDEGNDGSDIGEPSSEPQRTSEIEPTDGKVTNETNGEVLPSHETVTAEPAYHDQGEAYSDSRQQDGVEQEGIEPEHLPVAETPVQDAISSVSVEFKPMNQEEELEGGSEQGEECGSSQNGTVDETSLESIFACALMIGIASWLPAIYSVAVHIFLSTPNERKLTALHHWHPVFVRLAYGALAVSCYGVQVSLGRNSMNDTALIVATVTISALLLLKTRREEVDGPPPPMTSLEGRVIFITGSNTGIGKETARQLYQRGATVVFGCRSRARATAAMEDIDPAYREGQTPRMIFVELDLAKLSSVRHAAEEFLSLKLPLHVLILNAGLMRSRREVTEDGLELTLAANVVGHFLLTTLLLPKLRETARADERSTRVVTVSSSLYTHAVKRDGNGRVIPGLDLDDLHCAHKAYGLFDQYAQSKLANILFSQELGRREQLYVKSLPNTSPPLTPPLTKKPSKARLTPIEEPDTVFELFGNFAVVSSPSTSTPTEKSRRPKLTPVASNTTSSSDEESSNCEDGLGFEEIATPSTTPSPSPQRKNRKRLMPIPLDSDSDEDDIGLGYDDVVSSPKQIEKASALTSEGRTKVQPAGNSGEVDDVVRYPVRSFCLHPGLVRTDVVRDMPWFLYYPNRLFSVFIAALQKTPRSGAYTSVYCATAGSEEPETEYFVNSKPQPLREWAFDSDDAKGLWEKLSVMSS